MIPMIASWLLTLAQVLLVLVVLGGMIVACILYVRKRRRTGWR